MASPSKSITSLIASGPVTPGSTATSSWIDVSTFFEMLADVGIAIPGSAITVAPTITFNASPDNGTTVYQRRQLTGQLTAQSYPYEYNDATKYIQVAVKNNDATNNITVVADLTKIGPVA